MGAAVGLGGKFTGSSAATGGPGRWSHNWREGGPTLLAELSSEWSHIAGGATRQGSQDADEPLYVQGSDRCPFAVEEAQP